MRNSNVLAIAPTATISNITGTTPCIEPNYKNLYAKENLGGKFTILSTELVRDLKKIGKWDNRMLEQLKYFEGELANIEEIPEAIREKHRTVFTIDHEFVIDAAARRQKWIDQSQSVNLFIGEPDMRVVSKMYRRAWHTEHRRPDHECEKGTPWRRRRSQAGIHRRTKDGLLHRSHAQRRRV
jgi:ribonucleoside-diphosphate reductase alpha chain